MTSKKTQTLTGRFTNRFSLSIGIETGPFSASKRDPREGHDNERPTGWNWSGLRSPVGRA
jgi:hypothetical protein